MNGQELLASLTVKKRFQCSCKHCSHHQRTCHHICTVFCFRCLFMTLVWSTLKCTMHFMVSFNLSRNALTSRHHIELDPSWRMNTPFMERSLQNKDWFTSALPGETQIHPECELMSASPETVDFIFETIHSGIVSSSPSHSPWWTLFEEEWQRSCQEMMLWFTHCNDLVINELTN